LLTEATFRARIETLLAADCPGPDRYLVLMVLDIDGYSVVTGTAGRLGGLRAQAAVGSALRAGVHRDALLAHRSDAEFLVADVLPDPDATFLVENLRTAVACSTSRLHIQIRCLPVLRCCGFSTRSRASCAGREIWRCRRLLLPQAPQW
jgi:predicted signal transduction protein with EAL and GGDEF domain